VIAAIAAWLDQRIGISSRIIDQRIPHRGEQNGDDKSRRSLFLEYTVVVRLRILKIPMDVQLVSRTCEIAKDVQVLQVKNTWQLVRQLAKITP